jgi:uncharacterized protein YdaU (DUF1376 family)
MERICFSCSITGKREGYTKNRLAKIARVSDSRWAELQTALKEFFEDDGESWVHLRIERDIETVTSSSKSRPAIEGEPPTRGICTSSLALIWML